MGRESVSASMLDQLKKNNELLKTLKPSKQGEKPPSPRGKNLHRYSKYKAKESKVLGHSSGRVLEGKFGDGSKSAPCAVKLLYQEGMEMVDTSTTILTFRKAVELQRLLQSTEQIMSLLDFSTQADGKPGPDGSGKYWIVMPRADRTLREVLESRIEEKKPPSLDDDDFAVSEIVSDLGCMLAALKDNGVVHTNIRPENLMWVEGEGTWKLIDFDGAQRIGTRLVSNGRAVAYETGEPFDFATCYVSPEVCELGINATAPNMALKLSPKLDMWGTGLTVMELFFNTSILGGFFTKWREECGNHTKYLKFVADKEKPIIDEDVWTFVEDHYSSWRCRPFVDLVKPMLHKDQEKRMTVEAMQEHPFLEMQE